MAEPVGGDWQSLPLTTVVKQWKIQKELLDKGIYEATVTTVGPVRPVWWSDRWIPFGFAANGDLICVDLDPEKGGKAGQVVVFLHDNEERKCTAQNMTRWFDRLAADLKTGKITIFTE